MQTTYIKGYEVVVFNGYDGKELFISKDGQTVYSCRMSKKDSYLERAHRVIENQ